MKTLLDQFGRPLDVARYRAAFAQSSRLMDGGNPSPNLPYWRTAFKSVDDEVTTFEWKAIVAASEKLYSNLGPVKGAIIDKAVYSVGRAWQPEFLGTDQAWGEAAESWLIDEWYPIADIRGDQFDFVTDLYVASVSIDRSGDIFAMLTEETAGYPKIALVPGHRVGMRNGTEKQIKSGPYDGLRQSNGVAYNPQGRPVAYHVMGITEAEDRWVSARSMVHMFDPEWYDQSRGFPVFTHAINDLRSLMTTQGYEERAAMLASELGLIEENPQGMPDMSDPAIALTQALGDVNPSRPSAGLVTKTLEGGGYRYFQAGTGSKISTLKSDRPGQSWDSFMDRLIRNGCAGAGWPYELVWKSAELGGANVRLLVARAMRAVADRQDLLRPFAKRAVGYAVAKAIHLGILPPNDEWWKWGFSMPAEMTVDAGYDSQSAGEEIADGRRTLTDYLKARGIKLRDHLNKLVREQQMIDKAGIELVAQAEAMGLSLGDQPEEGEGEEDDEEETSDEETP